MVDELHRCGAGAAFRTVVNPLAVSFVLKLTPELRARWRALTGAERIALTAQMEEGMLVLTAQDDGSGFHPQVLDSLRQPLETGEAIIARANHRVTYPARIQMVAAMNPCRCGHAGEPGHQCRRGERCVTEYQARISGPFLDRIDLRIEVPAVTAADLIGPAESEPSSEVAMRVLAARKLQEQRFFDLGVAARTNAQAPASVVEKMAQPDDKGLAFLREAAETLQLSARGYHRVLKLARTLADLDGLETVFRIHFAEALSYRGQDLSRRAA